MQWFWLLSAPLAGWIAGATIMYVLEKITHRTETEWDEQLAKRLRAPARLIAVVLCERAALVAVELPASTEAGVERALSSALVVGLAWAVNRSLEVLTNELARRYEAAVSDAATARAARTRVLVLRRVLSVLVTLVAAALVLTQFELARQIGVSLLASAGIAGVVLGFAAQRSIATLLAGLQISIAQPVRIGDVVIIEGEWGTIEEITLTFVVVRVWDERRLVLPIGQLLEKPFQNWTRKSPQLMGTVFVYADYTVPIDALRAEVRRACESDPDWDGRVASLVVFDSEPTVLKLRAVVSAPMPINCGICAVACVKSSCNSFNRSRADGIYLELASNRPLQSAKRITLPIPFRGR
ncbi:MAG: mechanosensitive ion channel [Polyangiaceae bacterium]|nr:mechanosensitive ion channel [Polyangiaceae bacterium]